MQATCGNSGCGRSWTLQKNPEQYADGPRCPDCGNRDVDVTEAVAGNGEAAEVFAALEEGAEPIDLVKEYGVEPARARELADEFDALSEYVVLSGAELAARLDRREEEAREAERDRAKQKVRATRRKERQRAERDVANERHSWRRSGHMAGFAAGHEAAEEELRDEYEAELEEQVEELRRDHSERLKVVRNEAANVAESAEEAIADREETIGALRRQRDEFARRLELFQGSNEAAIWADGYKTGVAAPVLEDEARRDGLVTALKAMTS